MSWEPKGSNGPTTEGIQTPSRAQLNTFTAIKAPNATTQQGTAALTSIPQLAGGSGPAVFAKWS